jgi:hypothetical protein
MRILPLLFNVASTGQTSHYPCAPNTIVVRLRTNVPLKSDCRRDDTMSPWNRVPEITISGLSGARDNTISSLTSTDEQFSGVSPTLDAAQGEVKIQPASATIAGITYAFSFDITNQASGQAAPSIYVEADILTSSLHLMGPISADTQSYSMQM